MNRRRPSPSRSIEEERVACLLDGAVAARSPDRVRWIWIVYLVLHVLSIPWYLPSGPVRIWHGLPHWVVSLTASVAVAVFTLWVSARCWAADEPRPGERRFDGEAAG